MSDILLWAKFINAEEKEEFDMLATKNSYIGSAYEQLQIISQDKKKRLEYEAREKSIRDHNQMMYEAEQRGIKVGEERGKEIGKQETLFDVVKKFLALRLPIDTIAEGTGLSEEDVRKIQQENEF